MVASKESDGAVRHPLDRRFDIVAGGKRGIHFVIGIKRAEKFVRECDVMRAKFTGHRNSARSRVSQQSNAAGGTEMLTMDSRIAEFGEQNISCHDEFLRSSRPSSQAEHGAPVSLVHH